MSGVHKRVRLSPADTELISCPDHIRASLSSNDASDCSAFERHAHGARPPIWIQWARGGRRTIAGVFGPENIHARHDDHYDYTSRTDRRLAANDRYSVVGESDQDDEHLLVFPQLVADEVVEEARDEAEQVLKMKAA